MLPEVVEGRIPSGGDLLLLFAGNGVNEWRDFRKNSSIRCGSPLILLTSLVKTFSCSGKGRTWLGTVRFTKIIHHHFQSVSKSSSFIALAVIAQVQYSTF